MEGTAVVFLIPIVFATAFLTYQYMSLDRLQSEMSDMKNEIEQLQDQIQYELQNEEILELDITMDEIKQEDAQLPMLNIGDFDSEFGSAIRESDYQLWQDSEDGKFRVRRAVEEPDSKVTTNKRKIRHEKKDYPHCMHFTLNDKKVMESRHECDEDTLESMGNVSILCKVKEVPFWQNELQGSHSAGRLHHHDSKLRIARNGTYLIYSQLTFHDGILGAYYQIQHEKSDGTEVLSACAGMETFPKTANNETVYSFNQCHTDRVVRFSEGDHVYLENKRITSVIRTEPHLTFWGLFLLSD